MDEKNTRKAEVLVNGYWEKTDFFLICEDDVFRLFEEDGSEADHGQVCKALGKPEKDGEGVWGVKCKPVGREMAPRNPKEGMVIWIGGDPLRYSGGEWNGAALDRKEAR